MSMDKTKAALNSTNVLVAFSDDANFRKTLNPDYKSKRKDTRKPIVFNELKDWAMKTYYSVMRPGLEADDVLGILATQPGLGEHRIVVSEDKDLQTIPCSLYRQGELKEIDENEANYYWLLQSLTGDPTDGYPGCPGYGPVKAEKALKVNPTYASVESAYLKAGLTKEDALLNARMARILRWENWDKAKQEVKLWEP